MYAVTDARTVVYLQVCFRQSFTVSSGQASTGNATRPLSACLHPSGHAIAISFATHIGLYFVCATAGSSRSVVTDVDITLRVACALVTTRHFMAAVCNFVITIAQDHKSTAR